MAASCVGRGTCGLLRRQRRGDALAPIQPRPRQPTTVSELTVEHLRTGTCGLVTGMNGRGPAATCTVEFEHGVEEVPKSLLRPCWKPFELLKDSRVVHPYDGW